MLLAVQRQPQGESGSAPQGAGHLDRSVMVVDHFFCNVEPEAGAVFPLFGREIGFEDFPNFVFSNSVSSVSHLDISVKVLFLAIHNHLAMLLGRSLDGIHNDIVLRTRPLRRIPQAAQSCLSTSSVQLDTARTSP